MGKKNSKHLGSGSDSNDDEDDGPGPPPQTEVGFDDFEVLRAIGRGAFGKVCLVERKSTKKVYAMKYVQKQACLRQRAVSNICAEVEMLRALDHPFIVGLWFTFQDAEDLFLILEPLLGGDLRYHLNGGETPLSEEAVRFLVAEVGLALDFLRARGIVHRDVKPDNILLDEKGHARLTDFNVAARIPTATDKSRPLPSGMAGTKPYMAPEVFQAASATRGSCSYAHHVDWWSLGVTAYELRTGGRPFSIRSATSMPSSLQAIRCRCDLSSKDSPGQITLTHEREREWSPEFAKLIQSLLVFKPDRRVSSLSQLRRQRLMSNVNFASVLQRRWPPPYVPAGEGRRLHCDPALELEEMIVEANPLHKKKKRLQRQQTLLTQKALQQAQMQTLTVEAPRDPFEDFPTHNREVERYQEALRGEGGGNKLWEEELRRLVEARKNRRKNSFLAVAAGSVAESIRRNSINTFSSRSRSPSRSSPSSS